MVSTERFIYRERHVSRRCGLLFGSVAMALLAACDEETATPVEAPPPSVIVAPVTTSQVTASGEFVGRTFATHEVEIRARVSGFLDERFFREGGRVKAGQLLFQIDPSEFEAARKAAAAAVESVEAALVMSSRNLQRARALAERGNVSQASVDEAVATQARNEADLDAARAELEQAEISLSYTAISTPIDGRAGAASVDTGNLIGPDSGVLTTVVNSDPIRVEFAVTERELLDYRKRQQAGETQAFTPRLRLANGEMFGQTGNVTFIDNRVDPRTGTIKVRAEFPNPDALVVPGQFVNVVLSSSEARDAVVVPQAAIQSNQAGSFVLVVNADNRVETRSVALGERDGADIVVTEGLQVGETIIVEGLQKVRAGAAVTPVPLDAATGADRTGS